MSIVRATGIDVASTGEFRYEGIVGFARNRALRALVKDFLSRADRRAEREAAVADWTACRCALHSKIECGKPGVVGCAGLLPGLHSSQVGLYRGEHYSCVVEPGVRLRDKEVFDYVEGGGPYRPVRTDFMAGRGCPPEKMGAGYCYTHLFDPSFVVRVARLLGPLPALHRVLRWFLVFGRRDVMRLAIVDVGGGHLHVEPSSVVAMSPTTVIMLLISGMRPEVTVGGKDGAVVYMELEHGFAPSEALDLPRHVSARFDEFVAYLEARGCNVPEFARADFCMATTHLAMLPVEQTDVKDRVRKLQLIGDVALKYMVATRALSTVCDMGAASARMADASNVRLAELSLSEPIVSFLDAGTLLPGSKARGSLVEGMIGVVVVHSGMRQAYKVSVVLGLPVTMEGELSKVVCWRAAADPLGQIRAILDDVKRRSGDRAAVISNLATLVDDLAKADMAVQK